MSQYPIIANHGLIGNLKTAALVSTDGTIDWFCTPRFDSPSVFASLLDQDRGGRFRIGPGDPIFVATDVPRDVAIQRAAQQFADQLDVRVRRHPEFWYQFYRYWDLQDAPPA